MLVHVSSTGSKKRAKKRLFFYTAVIRPFNFFPMPDLLHHGAILAPCWCNNEAWQATFRWGPVMGKVNHSGGWLHRFGRAGRLKPRAIDAPYCRISILSGRQPGQSRAVENFSRTGFTTPSTMFCLARHCPVHETSGFARNRLLKSSRVTGAALAATAPCFLLPPGSRRPPD